VLLVSLGVLLSALSKPGASKSSAGPENSVEYTIGLVMLVTSLLVTGALGILQERTYERYGPVWREGVFYTVRGSGAALRDFL
jgi:solute carrier family 35 (UDP-xylose/UDP-N-acetylglucosamine transporter), member B4